MFTTFLINNKLSFREGIKTFFFIKPRDFTKTHPKSSFSSMSAKVRKGGIKVCGYIWIVCVFYASFKWSGFHGEWNMNGEVRIPRLEPHLFCIDTKYV